MNVHKRKRADGNGIYRYSAGSINPSYRTVYVRESGLRKANGLVATASTPKEVFRDPQEWSQTMAWLPESEDFALDETNDMYDTTLYGDVMDEVPGIEVTPRAKRMRSQVSIRPHVVWKEVHRSTYLDEILRFSGRGDFIHAKLCPDCLVRKVETPGAPSYRCQECLIPDLCCESCCIRRHRSQPFHRIQKWTGTHFVATTLKDIGLKIQLNHSSLFCDNPVPCHAAMIVMHTNGLHQVAFNYCGCSRALPHHIQLLRRGFYPATQLIIETCATFPLLDFSHKVAVCSKASTYDLYRSLEMLTNNSGVGGFSSRYRSFFRMNMQWRHLKLLKHGGRAQDPTGPDGTQNGELALRCLTCPVAGVNLPDYWRDVPESSQFLYRSIMCMDANFRLKNQLVSNYSQDPGLGIGWAYMVPRSGYEEYVLNRASDADISTCVGFQALAQANTRYSRGLRYTGVGGVFCGRSEMVLPNGIGNLQKGERYANMDYLFAFASRLVNVNAILISYDICCQWFINLRTRMRDHWPEEIKNSACTTATLTPAIPKLHEPMHEAANHQQYSLNVIPGVGDSDLEGPERVWAGHNPVGNSTKTQGPGSRQDVLDDHFAAWNWWKVIRTGTTQKKKYIKALANRNIQVEAHRGLTESIGKELEDEWEEICVTWEQDASHPKRTANPYEVAGVAITEAEAKKQLAVEEAGRLKKGGAVVHATSVPAFVSLALDIEDSQRRLRRVAKGTNTSATALQEGSLTQQRNQLTTRIRAWEQLLPLYMPGLLQYQADIASKGDASSCQHSENPEDQTVWLPSKVAVQSRALVCLSNIQEIEETLRTAQCHDALDSIRHTLKIKARLVKFKNKNIRGQREGTRSRAIIDRVHEKARSMAEKYRASRVAKLALAGNGDWEQILKPLADADVRGYQDPNLLRTKTGRRGTLEDHQRGQTFLEENVDVSIVDELEIETASFVLFTQERERRDGTGESRKTLSWIWTTGSRADNPDNANDDIMRAEWAKSRARANRAHEEVQLVREEMRRALETLRWQESQWKGKIGLRQADRALEEALKAHAETQILVRRTLGVHFERLWKEPLALVLARGEVNGVDQDDDDEATEDFTAEDTGVSST